MIKYLFFGIPLLFLTGCNPSNQTIVKENSPLDTTFQCNCPVKVEPFNNLDTLLSGEYYLRYYFEYSAIDSLCKQVVDLMNGAEKINNINWLDYRMKRGSLGWLEFDCRENFVFMLGVSSSPNIFLIIKKSNGVEKYRGFFHGRIDDVMLYSTFEDELGTQELRLFDFGSDSDFEVTRFNNLKCEWDEGWFADCVGLKQVTKDKIVLSMFTNKGEIVYEHVRD